MPQFTTELTPRAVRVIPLTAAILAFLPFGAQSADPQVPERAELRVRQAHMPPDQNWAVSNDAMARQRVQARTGLAQDSARVTVELVVIESDNTPFLAEDVLNGPKWLVVSHGEVLPNLGSGSSNKEDERDWEIVLDPRVGNIITVVSRWPAGEPRILPEPPSEDYARELKSHGEVQHGWCPVDTPVTFVEALRTMFRETDDPSIAKQIKGQCVMWSTRDSDPRPVWVITLRGVPYSIPCRIPGLPVSVCDHMRYVIDAVSGKWIGAANLPSPARIKEE